MKKFYKEFSCEIEGKLALFSEPHSRISGEKLSYRIPTNEALVGIVKNIYWKPSINIVVDAVRIMNPIKFYHYGVKTLNLKGGESKSEYDIHIYGMLSNVKYQIKWHWEFNKLLASDYYKDANETYENIMKHNAIMERSIKMGGRRSIYLGTTDCPASIEPVEFGVGDSYYDNQDEDFPRMFLGYSYPEYNMRNKLLVYTWEPKMRNGIIEFPNKTQGMFVPDNNIKVFDDIDKDPSDRFTYYLKETV